MQGKGLSERGALKVVRMSASSLLYEASPDKNVALRQAIVELAQRHRRCGSEMIYLKLRQAGEQVNHKRVERLYTQEGLQVRRRQRKKIPVSERQPLVMQTFPKAASPAAVKHPFADSHVAPGRAVPGVCILRVIETAPARRVPLVLFEQRTRQTIVPTTHRHEKLRPPWLCRPPGPFFSVFAAPHPRRAPRRGPCAGFDARRVRRAGRPGDRDCT
jgi:transposase InsO family protein